MENTEFQGYLKSLFLDYIQPNLKIGEKVFEQVSKANDDALPQSFSDTKKKLQRAMSIINYIKEHCRRDEDIYTTFNRGKLIETLKDVRDVLILTKGVADTMGFLALADKHFKFIVPQIESKNLPIEDFNLLKELGVIDPKSEIDGSLFHMKKIIENNSKQDMSSHNFVTMYLDQTIEEIKAKIENLEASEKKRKKTEEEKSKETKKPGIDWVTGVGKIVTGTGLVVCDIALIVGSTAILGLPETTASIASTTTGFGHIIIGVTDWLKN